MWLEIDEDVQIRLTRSAISGKVNTSGPATERAGSKPKPKAELPESTADKADKSAGDNVRMIRRLWVSVAAIISVAIVLLGLNLGLGNTPALGLDLQGGLSVILAPTGGASGDDLLVIRDLIRDELERRGIAEPDVRVEGQNIIVDLPGVRDQADALDAVDVAGIVTLRPVFQCFAGPEPGASSTTTPGSGPPGSTTPGSTPATTPGSSTAGTAPTATASPPASTPTSGAPGHAVRLRQPSS